MHVAIDIDDTLTAHPATVVALACALRAAGHTVAYLTGGIADPLDLMDHEKVVAFRKRQLASYGEGRATFFVALDRTEELVGARKGAYCKENGVSLFIDNSGTYCRAVRAASPATMVCQVWQ